jgi:hypothetical protein
VCLIRGLCTALSVRNSRLFRVPNYSELPRGIQAGQNVGRPVLPSARLGPKTSGSGRAAAILRSSTRSNAPASATHYGFVGTRCAGS